MEDALNRIRSDHNTRDNVSYSFLEVSGFFNIPYYLVSNKGYEMGPQVYSPYPRRLESVTICECNYKGSTFSTVTCILRPRVLVWPELSSQPPAWQHLMLNQLSHRCSRRKSKEGGLSYVKMTHFLLLQVGGVGITLTAADRVVICKLTITIVPFH